MREGRRERTGRSWIAGEGAEALAASGWGVACGDEVAGGGLFIS